MSETSVSELSDILYLCGSIYYIYMDISFQCLGKFKEITVNYRVSYLVKCLYVAFFCNFLYFPVIFPTSVFSIKKKGLANISIGTVSIDGKYRIFSTTNKTENPRKSEENTNKKLVLNIRNFTTKVFNNLCYSLRWL